jgi:hypothetical protein
VTVSPIAIEILAAITFTLGLAAFITPWTLDRPGWGWLWRFQEPEWPLGVGALWMGCGVLAMALSRRPRAAAVILLGAALVHPLALGSGCVDPFCGYYYWHSRPTVIPLLDVASVVIALGAGVILGRTSRRPSRRGTAVALAVVGAVATILVAGWTVVAAFLAGMEGSGHDMIPASLVVDVTLVAVTGVFIGRATIASSPRVPD